MSDGVNIKFDTSRFEKELKALSLDMQIKAVGSGMSAAANLVKKNVVALAPTLKHPSASKHRVAGTLKKAIYASRSRSRSNGGRVVYTVGVRTGGKAAKSGRDAFYWRFLEAGWQPRGKGQRLKGGNNSRALQRSRNRKLGAKFVRYPFIAPAFESSKEAALDKVKFAVERYITRLKQGKK